MVMFLSTIVRPNPMIADFVEAIWDFEILDRRATPQFTCVSLPSCCPLLAVQYADPFWSDRRMSPGFYRQVATGIQTGVIRMRGTGLARVITVLLKPQAAARIIGANIPDFVDANVALCDIFGAGEMSLSEEMLAQASGSAERVACLEVFLLKHVRWDQPDSLACHAAAWLRRHPDQSIGRLASKFEISERHLSRAFRTMFGIGPKRFARIVRIGKVLSARRRGETWASAAYGCGYSDQAHMINDFNDLIDMPPGGLLRWSRNQRHGELNGPLAESDFYIKIFV
jgi:AraC-like DNA-binding protein